MPDREAALTWAERCPDAQHAAIKMRPVASRERGWVWLNSSADAPEVKARILRLDGIEAVRTREEAARDFKGARRPTKPWSEPLSRSAPRPAPFRSSKAPPSRPSCRPRSTRRARPRAAAPFCSPFPSACGRHAPRWPRSVTYSRSPRRAPAVFPRAGRAPRYRWSARRVCAADRGCAPRPIAHRVSPAPDCLASGRAARRR